MAPMTRNRGFPLSNTVDNKVWLADKTVALYYSQRASPGGLLITEGIPPSLEASGMPGVPGLFDPSQLLGWKAVVDGVHAKGGYIYAQLWHAGRATIPHMTGCPVVSASATPWDTDETFPFRTADTKEKIKYKDFPPVEMSEENIKNTTRSFVEAAKAAIGVGFDGIEINGGNGNLLDQFLHSDINTRVDAYGGSPEARCKFPLDLVAAVVGAIGASNVGIRLEPAGLYNGTYGTERVETWSYLCKELASYSGDNKPSFRDIIQAAEIPCFTCGGWNADNASAARDPKGWDGVAFAKWFVSNPDLPERLRLGKELQAYDRSRFYGSWDGVMENGYTDYLTWEELSTGA